MTGSSPGADQRRYSRRRILKTGGVATVAGLAGCAGNGDPGTETTGTGGQTTESSGETTGTPGTQDVTISFWPAWGGYYEETFDEMLANFQDEYDHITIDRSDQGNYDESRNALFNAANAGNPPDIGHLGKADAVVASDSGFFTPIEDVWPDMNTGDYLGAAMGTSVIEDTVWSLPFNNSQIILYYNKGHFEEAGLDPETPPATLEELASMSNTIVDEGVADYGVSWPNHSWWVRSWISEQQAFVCDQENGRAGEPTETNFTSDEAQNVFEFWMNDLGDAYHNPGIEDYGSSEQAFQNEVASMHMNSTGSLAYSLAGFEENDIEVGVASLPVPGEKVGHPMGGASVWVTDKDRSTAEQEAIQTFLQNMLGPEQQAYYHRQTGYLPSHSGSIDRLQEEGWFDENPDTYEIARQQLDAWQDLPMTQGILMGPASDINQEIAVQSDEMMQGKAIDQALQDLKSYSDDQLDRYSRA